MNVQESRIGRRGVVGLALSVAAAVSAAPIGQEKRFAHAMILTERSGKKGLWLMLQPRGLIMVIR